MGWVGFGFGIGWHVRVRRQIERVYDLVFVLQKENSSSICVNKVIKVVGGLRRAADKAFAI